ncbi:peptidoglycan DD-metalloendopeptidase family protein [Myxococcota bacterium]|nr:peptidoglycan DD-metalloendopeptidase family protein [Myxococcota bacterium]
MTAGVCLFAVALAVAQPAPGTEHPNDRGPSDTPEAEAMRKRVAQDKVKVDFLRKEESSILKGLEQLDRSLAEKSRKVKSLAEDVKKLERTVVKLDAQLASSEAELAQIRADAGRRVAAMHRLRRTRITEVFREVRSPLELRRLRERLRVVLAYDSALVTRAHAVTDGVRMIRDDATAKRDALTALRASLAQEIEDAAMLRAERAALLEAIRKEKRASERLQNELVAAAKRLERELGVVRGAGPLPELGPGGFDAQQGKLPWPVMGRVEVPFGKKVDPGSGMVMVAKGIDIRAPIAEPVRAVFGGTVAFADWFEGFGRLVILEHEGGFYTLYAHLEDLEVSKGQRVNAFQVIGLVGDSGSTKGAYLYFEIRKGRDAVDPMKWLVD